ncbi:MAG: SCO family protein [Gammaproteobacteria bacterium]|nr:SCO family protein [Gammaproteobacteria bacterium]
MSVLRTLAVSVSLIVLGLVTLAMATDHFQAFTSETARRVEVRQHPRPLPPVTLESQTGERFNLAGLQGKWLVVDFIYTRCVTLCSVLGGTFAQLQNQLATPLAQNRIQLLSISFDPERDTPAQLADYLYRFNNHGTGWLAARPLNAQGLDTLKHVFGVTVVPDNAGGYVHNDAIVIVDPAGRLVNILDSDTPAKSVGEIVLRYLNR